MKFWISAVLVACLVLPVGMVQEAAAQVQAKKAAPVKKKTTLRRVVAPELPLNAYETYSECEQALKQKRGYYVPTFFGERGRKPKRPVASTRALEADGCAYLKVAGGMYAWVPQKKGTLYDYDAEYHPIRRHDCGNSVVEIRYPKAEPVLRAIVAAEAEPRAEAEPVPPAEAPPVFTSTPAVPVKVRQDGVVNIVGNNNEVDFRSIKVIERVHPVVVERHGMSTGTKWVIGGVAAGIVGGLVYFLVKKDKKEPAKSSSGLAPRP